MQTFEDDDLTNVAAPAAAAAPAPAKTVAPAAAAAAPAPAQTKPAAASAPAAKKADLDDEEVKPAAKASGTDDDVHDTDFDDEKVMARPGQINRVRPDKGKAVRLAFVKTVRMKTAKSHFIEIGSGKDEKKGTYRCLIEVGHEEQGYCCQKYGKDSTIHIAALVIVYKNADPVTGKYTKQADGTFAPIQWELGYVDLSGFNMKQIKKLPDEESTPYDIDIIMTHADGRAFGYEFNRASSKARWLQNPELVAEVEAAAERFKDGKTLSSKLGKRLTPLEWKALLGGVGGEEAKLDNMEEL